MTKTNNSLEEEENMKKVIILVLVVITLGCATLTEDAMTPIAISFSDGSNGKCTLQNKRGSWDMDIPATIYVRKSDDALRLLCKTDDGRETSGFIESEMGAKIIASAIFLDLGITDAITDKHRKYAPSYVIPIKKIENSEKEAQKAPTENNKVSP